MQEGGSGEIGDGGRGGLGIWHDEQHEFYEAHASPHFPDSIFHIRHEILQFANDGLRVGLRVDARDCWKDIWCAAEICAVVKLQREVRVHFYGWSECWNETISIDEGRIAPLFSKLKLPDRTTPRKGSLESALSVDVLLVMESLRREFSQTSNLAEIASIVSK
eukprot:TRINITY_DN8290_c0_g1_i2.p1 TRINITY_DN8290_c0_g1~~TRINITY_DN8290_c0_g1_i2.p1  ORF type:complete len:186 (-),score=18.51 TRINITY_DN8290_c0_g1_i2:174-662(-)